MHGPKDVEDDASEEYSCQEVWKHRVPPMLVSELKDILVENEVEVKGRASFKNYIELAERHEVNLARINLTFRQF